MNRHAYLEQRNTENVERGVSGEETYCRFDFAYFRKEKFTKLKARPASGTAILQIRSDDATFAIASHFATCLVGGTRVNQISNTTQRPVAIRNLIARLFSNARVDKVPNLVGSTAGNPTNFPACLITSVATVHYNGNSCIVASLVAHAAGLVLAYFASEEFACISTPTATVARKAVVIAGLMTWGLVGVIGDVARGTVHVAIRTIVRSSLKPPADDGTDSIILVHRGGRRRRNL